MAEQQLRLFEHAKPLLARFGAGFFRRVPACPGVYIMRNEAQRVIYVGQSKNLRLRLGTYRNANPAHVSRKTIRLVHDVRRIEWEECDSALSARLRENALLRLHQPKYNSVNKYPGAYGFMVVEMGQEIGASRKTMPEPARLFLQWGEAEVALPPRRLKISLSRTEPGSGLVYGAFKRAGHSFAALGRMFWWVVHKASLAMEFPCGIFEGRALSHQYELGESEEPIQQALSPFLEGISEELLVLFRGKLASAKIAPFLQTLLEADLATLEEFFRCGPQRNYELRRQHNLEHWLIRQEQLDDLLVLSRHNPSP